MYPRSALAALEEGRFFEAHEELEAAWREAYDADVKRFLQAAAQLAAAAHKLSTMRRVRGALAIAERARAKLDLLPERLPVDPPLAAWKDYARALCAAAAEAHDGRPFEIPEFVARS